MYTVRLHFPDPGAQALCLIEGSYGIGWHDDGCPGQVSEAEALIRIKVNYRGIWMSVSTETARVHVNGRRVYRIALLRGGDVIHLESAELRLVSLPSVRVATAVDVSSEAAFEADPRLVLRALGGADHGRCFALSRPCLVGRDPKADVQIDDPTCGERHAWLEQIHQGQVLLRHPDALEHSMVNGQPLHETVLVAGDQVAFTPWNRFVIEAPDIPTMQVDMAGVPSPSQVLPRSRSLRPLVWLLAAAALLAALLAGVLLFGVT